MPADYPVSSDLRDYCSTAAERVALARIIRREVGAEPWVPVVVTAADGHPALRGRGADWMTRGGRPVLNPSAYRRAWGEPLHAASTLRVEVGRDWIIWLCDLIHEATSDGVRL